MLVNSQYLTLNDMMRKVPLNAETVAEFRDKALQAVDHAIDTFFKPEREVAEGKQAYDQLSDVERALRFCQGRFQGESKKVQTDFEAERAKLTADSFKGDVGQTPSVLPGGKPLTQGYREITYSQNRVSGQTNIQEEQRHVGNVIQKMSELLPLYASVAMVPGPLSVSLKDHLKQSLQWSTKSDSQTKSSMQEESYRLFTLSAGKKVISSSSSSHGENKGKEETVTVDERVMPGLHEIRSAITRLGFTPGEIGEFSAHQTVAEYEKSTVTQGWFVKSEKTVFTPINKGELIKEGQALARPARIHLQGTSGNDGLTRPGEASDLVDLVANAELNHDFVDTLRERCLKILDGSVETLFNTQREVADGRKRYDELVNLQRAVELARGRFGHPDRYSVDPLDKQIAKMNQLTPLYACVAMVPGEMSSSVKNHAKELLEATYETRTSASTVSHQRNISLFGSIGKSHGSSSENSGTSGFVRQETITTDERIMPTLHELRMQLDQLQIVHDRNDNPYLTVSPG